MEGRDIDVRRGYRRAYSLNESTPVFPGGCGWTLPSGEALAHFALKAGFLAPAGFLSGDDTDPVARRKFRRVD